MFQTIQRYLLGIGLVYSLVMTGLYLTTSKELKLLQSSSEAVKQALKECISNKDKIVESKGVDEEVSTSTSKTIKSLQDDKESLLNELETLKSKSCKKEKNANENVTDDGIANIGDTLSPDIVGLLSRNDNKN